MAYKYILESNSLEYMSPWLAVHQLPWNPNFPIKITYDLFNRCLKYISKSKGLVVYDPCCWSWYLLLSLWVFFPDKVWWLYWSDINNKSLEIAAKNLSLLSRQWQSSRKLEIEQWNKKNKVDSIHALEKIQTQLWKNSTKYEIFFRDILSWKTSRQVSPDLILADVPYNNMTSWEWTNPINILLSVLEENLKTWTIIAIIHNLPKKVIHDKYNKLEAYKIWKRKIVILKYK